MLVGKFGLKPEKETNRSFPSSLLPLFQNESKCETILMKFDLHEN